MFSGIVQELGIINKIITKNTLKIFYIIFKSSAYSKIGDSISINGTCLTITSLNKEKLIASFDIINETLKKTNLNQLKEKQKVNIEIAIKYGDCLGGHIIEGHIDEVGKIKNINKNFNVSNQYQEWLIEIYASKNFLKYLVNKGFIAIDGMSITIIKVLTDSFLVTLIPHTIEVTIAKNYTNSSIVNLEADAKGKYIYKYIEGLKEKCSKQ